MRWSITISVIVLIAKAALHLALEEGNHEYYPNIVTDLNSQQIENLDHQLHSNADFIREVIRPTSSTSRHYEIDNEDFNPRRILQNSDFSELNEFMETMILRIPDQVITDFNFTLFPNANFVANNLIFKRVKVRDIQDSFREEKIEDIADDKYNFNIVVDGLDLIATMDFEFYLNFVLEAKGRIRVQVVDTLIDMIISFQSTDFDMFPPSYATLGKCDLDIDIDDIDLEGDFLVEMLSLFDNVLRKPLEDFVEETICNIVNDGVNGALTEVLRQISAVIEPYFDSNFVEIDNDILDLPIPSSKQENTIDFVDFSNPNSTIGNAIGFIIQLVDTFLATEVEDPDNPYGLTKDLGVNTLLRSNVLDQNQALTYDIETQLYQNSTVMNTTITLTQAAIYGLDSFKSFNPIKAFSQTLASNFDLSFLKLDAALKIILESPPQTSPDATSISIPQAFTEEVFLSMKLTDIFLNVSALVLLDLDNLRNINIGSFLNTTNLLPCSFASMKDFSLENVGSQIDVLAPELDRFIDPRLGNLTTSLFEALQFMSENVIASALPRFLATTFRENVTSFAKSTIDNITAEECPIFFSNPTNYLDFRDLLLEPEVALNQGATGMTPYGDVCPFIKKIIDENFIIPGADGTPAINSLIRNSTEDGQFAFNETIPMCFQPIPQQGIFSLSLRNISVSNIDTISYPFDIFTPVGASALRNQIIIGSEERPMTLGVRFIAETTGLSPETDEFNDFYFSIEFTKMEILFALVAILYEERFMQFAVSDITDINCWLATFPVLEDPNAKALGISELELDYEKMKISFDCLDCSNQGELPNVIEIANRLGGIDLVTRMIITFVKEFLLQPGNQESIDLLIANAPKKCSHHPDFGEPVNETDIFESADVNVTLPPLPTCIPSGGKGLDVPFSRDAHEAFLFLLLFFAEVGYASISLLFDASDFVPSDPLEIQNSLAPSKTDELLLLSNLNQTFLNWLDAPLKEAIATVTEVVDDPTHPNGKDLRANVLIRQLQGDEGGVTIPINFWFNQTAIRVPILVSSVRLIGLDSFEKLVPVEFIGPQTLQSQFNLETLDIELVLSVVSPVQGFAISEESEVIIENTTISLGFRDIRFSLGLFLGINEQALRRLQLGSVFKIDQLLPCLMRTIDKISITQMLLSIGSIRNTKIQGFVSNEISELVENLQAEIFEVYGKRLTDVIPTFSDVYLREIANNFLNSFAADEAKCELFEPTTGTGFIDFRDLFLSPEAAFAAGGKGTEPYGGIFSALYNLMQKSLLDPNEKGIPKINDLVINSLTRSQSNIPGTILLDDPIVSSEVDLSKRFRTTGTLKIKAGQNSSISNLDTIGYPLTILFPTDANALNNSLNVGFPSKPVRISTSAMIELVDEEGNAAMNSFELSISLTHVGIEALVIAKIKEESFMAFPFEDIVNIDCWISSFPSRNLDEFGVAEEDEEVFLGIDDLKIFVDQLPIEIRCLECDSPELEYYAEVFTGVSFMFFTQTLLASDLIQNLIDRRIFKAVKTCPHSPQFDPNFDQTTFVPFERPDDGFDSSSSFLALFLFAAVCVVALCCAGYLVNRKSKRDHAKWLLSLSDDEILALCMDHHQERQQAEKLSKVTKSMFLSEEVPPLLRYIIPIVVLLNVGLFVSGHLNRGATLDIHFYFAGQPFKISGLYTYAIIQLIGDMWRNASKILTVIVFIASVLWPYTKQTITLILWFAPPYLVSVERRGYIFRYLDFLAKWSIIDIFVITIGVVVMRVKLRNSSSFPEEYFGADLFMLPLWGLYANGLAQIVSQVSSHFIIYYHDKVTVKGLLAINAIETGSTNATESSDYITDSISETPDGSRNSSENDIMRRKTPRKEALCNHSFILGGWNRGLKVKIKPETNYIVGFIGFITLACIVVGCFTKYLRVEMTGIIAGAISAGNDGKEAVFNHSILTVAGTILEVGQFVGFTIHIIGAICLLVLVVVTCTLVPLAQCTCLLILWFATVSKERRHNLMVVLEILKAWQYLEVYFLGTIVMMWQASPITANLMSAICWPLQDVFSALARFDIIEGRDSRCFLINASLEVSVAVHIIAALLLWWLTKFVEDALDQQSIDHSIIYGEIGETKKGEESVDVDNVFDQEKKMQELINHLQKLPVRFTDKHVWATAIPVKSKPSRSTDNLDTFPSIDIGVSVTTSNL